MIKLLLITLYVLSSVTQVSAKEMCQELWTEIGTGSEALVLQPEEIKFIQLINQYRQSQTPPLGRLRVSLALTRAARWLSNDNYHVDDPYHVDSLGRDARPRLKAFGYDYKGDYGENIFRGRTTAQEVFDGWKRSPGHNRIMLKPKIQVMGIGKVDDSWTLNVGQHVDQLLDY